MSHKRNWRDIFTERYSENGFNQEAIAVIYRIEMELRAFFEFGGIVPDCLSLQNIERDNEEIRYYWESHSGEALCPFCGETSHHLSHDYYCKPVQDIPESGLAVYHVVRFQKYRCDNDNCSCKEFVERFCDFSEEDARKTIRFKKYCVDTSSVCGCNPAERRLRAEGAVVSNDSIATYLKSEAAKQIKSNLKRDDVRVLAVDDINLRKGDKASGCTVFVDQEAHKVLIIVKGTTKEATKKVMESFPSALYLSRDRASSYASAGDEFGKIQVADRFHLIKNAQQAVKDALMAEIPASIFVRDGDGWVQIEGSEDGKSFFYAPEQTVEDRIKLATLSSAKAKKYRDTLKMLELSDKGLKTADIARSLSMRYNDVQALRRTAVSTLAYVDKRISERSACVEEPTKTVVERPGRKAKWTLSGDNIRPASESIVEPYRETVIAMWKAGGNHRTIFPVIVEQGYTGSKNAIYQYLLKLGKEEPKVLKRERIKEPPRKPWMDSFDKERAEELPNMSLESVPRDSIYKHILKTASDNRSNAMPNNYGEAKIPKEKTYENSKSPLSQEVWELMHGIEKSESLDKVEKPQKKTD